MYDWTIKFTRRDGTTGKDTFTEPTESAARHAFRECYRHGGSYHIDEIEYVVSGKTVADQLDNMAGMDNIDPAQREALTYAASCIRFLEEQAKAVTA